jgi:hypothetical protein
MYKFFKDLGSVAGLGKEYKSIRELTIDLARSGGYRREMVTLKNGKKVLRTKYGIESNNKVLPTWNDVLVAKWLYNYKDLFLSKLGAHPELRDFYPEIIQRTFTITFNALQIDKLKSDSNVNTIVYMCLANRIGDALIKKGSDSRLESYDKSGSGYNKNTRERINLKTAVNTMALSLEALMECGFNIEVPCGISETVISLEKALQGNPMGKRLLDSLMYSNAVINTNSIDKFVKLSDKERTPETLKQLKDAWCIIKSTLHSSLAELGYNVGVYDWEKDVKFKYSKLKNSVKGENS